MKVVGYNSGGIVGVTRGYSYVARGDGLVEVASDAGYMVTRKAPLLDLRVWSFGE
jgi:hypothetical protein